MVRKKRRIFVLAGIILAFISIISCNQNKKVQKEEVRMVPDTIAPPAPMFKYGLPVDSFSVTEGVVKSNQYLSQILNAYGVGMGTIDQVAKKSKPVFDVRKIRSGQNYTIFQTPDSLKQTRYFVYEDSPTDYYVFELFDSLRVYKGEKEVEKRQKMAQGIIETSLWNTMYDNNLDPMLALDLNDIYQWTIDFYAIQKGDRFRVIYDELYVDSVSIGIGTIYAVEFDHYGESNFAFRFLQDGRYDYFDENGKSLRKAFLKAPLHFTRISSRFSNSRWHPVLRIRRPHHGVDYAAPKGTPVMSIGDGDIVARGYQRNGGGNYLKIKHNSQYTTSYMHLSGFAKGMVAGKRVKQGEVIGFVGATGLATGPHLDFRVFKNGTPVDPLKVKSDPVAPVNKENVLRYTLLKDSLMNELQQIEWQQDDLLLAKTK